MLDARGLEENGVGALAPQRLRRQPRALDQRFELGPGDLRRTLLPSPQSVPAMTLLLLTALCEASDALGDQLRDAQSDWWHGSRRPAGSSCAPAA